MMPDCFSVERGGCFSTNSLNASSCPMPNDLILSIWVILVLGRLEYWCFTMCRGWWRPAGFRTMRLGVLRRVHWGTSRLLIHKKLSYQYGLIVAFFFVSVNFGVHR